MKKLLAILIFITVSSDVLSQRKQKKKNTIRELMDIGDSFIRNKNI